MVAWAGMAEMQRRGWLRGTFQWRTRQDLWCWLRARGSPAWLWISRTVTGWILGWLGCVRRRVENQVVFDVYFLKCLLTRQQNTMTSSPPQCSPFQGRVGVLAARTVCCAALFKVAHAFNSTGKQQERWMWYAYTHIHTHISGWFCVPADPFLTHEATDVTFWDARLHP